MRIHAVFTHFWTDIHDYGLVRTYFAGLFIFKTAEIIDKLLFLFRIGVWGLICNQLHCHCQMLLLSFYLPLCFLKCCIEGSHVVATCRGIYLFSVTQGENDRSKSQSTHSEKNPVLLGEKGIHLLRM